MAVPLLIHICGTSVPNSTILSNLKLNTAHMSTNDKKRFLKLCIHTVEDNTALKKNELLLQAAVWMTLKNIMLSESTSPGEHTVCMESLYRVYDGLISIKYKNRQSKTN